MTQLPTSTRSLLGFEVPPHLAWDHVRSGRLQVLDIRVAEEYLVAHIPGAVHCPRAELKARLDEFDRSLTWLIVDELGSHAGEVRLEMQAHGFPAVHALQDGMAEWQGDLTTSTDFSAFVDTAAPVRERPPDWIDPDLLRAIADDMNGEPGRYPGWLPVWLLPPSIRKPNLRWW